MIDKKLLVKRIEIRISEKNYLNIIQFGADLAPYCPSLSSKSDEEIVMLYGTEEEIKLFYD